MDKERQRAAVDFYNSLYEEISSSYQKGRSELKKRIGEWLLKPDIKV